MFLFCIFLKHIRLAKVYISWWSLPYVSFVFQCLIFIFLLQTLFIQPYSNVGLKSFSRSYLIIQFVLFSMGCRSTHAICTCSHMQADKDTVDTHLQTYLQIHAHSYSYTHAMTMRNTHLLLRSQSHICSVFKIQSLTHSATKVMQFMCGVRCCYPVILLYLRKNGNPVI